MSQGVQVDLALPAEVSREPRAPESSAADAGQSRAAQAVRRLLESADVVIDGDRPWDVRVNDPRLYRRVAREGLLGLGEAYLDGWWDCDALDQLFDRCLRAGLPDRIPPTRAAVGSYLWQTFTNPQRPGLSRRNVESHYHTGTDVFQATLDERLMYTCGYWRRADTLAAAQEAKLELICRKLRLRPGQRVLDIGSGWGGFARYAAEQHGVEVVGVTISSEQAAYAVDACRGLPVEIRLQDYREVTGTFDHVVSVGTLEHIGPKNYRTFMEVAHRCLRDDGLFLLHFLSGRTSFPSLGDTELLWITKYIFPGGVMPSMKQVAGAAERRFVVEDVHNFGSDYDPTLMAWFANFERNWPSLEAKYGPRFYRMWKYYLLSCAGAFRARRYQLYQFVFSKGGVRGGYESVR
jgi:cyclopropane-fatty-acyl-phospholipid synthase